MDFTPPSRIAVVGPGQLGGSLLMALRSCAPAAGLTAWARREEAVRSLASSCDGVTATTNLASAVKDAGLVVLCVPVEAMPALAAEITSHLTPGCVVTDVGSVKKNVVTSLEQVFQNSSASFVGSHPMAGSERSGIDAARVGLFEGAVSIITPTIFTTERALQMARWLWRSLGCNIVEMSAEDHDRTVARISHLPHLAAAGLTLAALRHDPSAASCAGPGFRDSTRIAAGDPALWTGIISMNRDEIISALREARDVFSELLAIVGSGDDKTLLHLLEEAKALRDAAVPA